MGPSDLDVLIVDDHEAMRVLFSRGLAKAGVQKVRTAETGAEALGLLRERAANLILADNRMPGMSGVEFVAAVRSEPALGAPKIVIVSGDGNAAFSAQALSAGADAVLTKPVSLADLTGAINQLFAV